MMFKQILIFIITIITIYAIPTGTKTPRETYQQFLTEEFIEIAEEMMKIERWRDNANVYKIAFEIVQLGKNGEKYKFYGLYNKLFKTKKTSKQIKDKFDEMSEIILEMD